MMSASPASIFPISEKKGGDCGVDERGGQGDKQQGTEGGWEIHERIESSW